MDALSDVFDHIRSAGALLGKNLMAPPWSIRITDGASMTLVAMLRGDGWVLPDGAEPVRLHTHDLAIVTGPEPFTLTSDAEAPPPPLYIQTAGDTCTDADGNPVTSESICLGVRTCGTRMEADHVLLTGSFAATGRIAGRLLTTLPRVLVVPHEQQSSAPLQLLETEIGRDEPGQQAVLDRLLDLVLIGTLRDWFALPESCAPDWYRAASDPIVGTALTAIEGDPARAWTVASLAREAQVSRATFARRFTELVGESPIAYLTGWRLCLAADLLERGDDTVESIARQVGYSTAFALSAAFTREFGIRPTRHRALTTSA